MAKRKRLWDKDKIEARIATGYGQGRGDAYRPWLRIQDVPSDGNVWRTPGVTHNRTYHFMSEGEQRYGVVLDLARRVSEIREQFPLFPIEETIAIADACGVDHPADPKTGAFIVMTTDVLVSVGADEYPRTYKRSEALEKANAIEHLEIERRYWARRDKPLKIVTQHEVPDVLVANALWVHPKFRLDGHPELTLARVRHIAAALGERVAREDAALCDIALACDDDLGMKAGASLVVARHLIATGQWAVDMYAPLGGEHRLVLLAAESRLTA